MSAPVIRQLTSADAAIYRDLRLEALKTAPTAYGSSYERESQNSLADFEGYFASSHIAGAFIDGALVGIAGFRREEHMKVAHRGTIWGVYVQPAAQGQGVARALITELLAVARQEVRQVHLSVVTENERAYRLYQQLGFTTYGTEPRSLFVDGRYLDEHMMVLRFD